MVKQQLCFLKGVGLTPHQAYESYKILPMDMYIKKSCTNIVGRILKDETHPLIQALGNKHLPKKLTRNS